MIKYLLLTITLLLAYPVQDAFAQHKICKGITSKGTKCTREVEPGYNYCYNHLIQDPNVKQCEGKTEKGVQCKLPAEKNSKYCKIHDPNKKKCEAKTRDGNRCKNPTEPGSKYCKIHQPIPPKSQCKAKIKNGSRCSRKATTQGYCQQHYKMYKQGKLQE